jgi:PhnB protein
MRDQISNPPRQRPPVTPYLAVADAKATIEFYVNAFGAVERFRLPAEDGKKVMHAELEIAGGTIFLSDMGPPREPSGVSIALGLENAKAVDVLAKRLGAHGATITFGPEDMFWGDRFAEVTDPFGHRWMLTAPKD